MKSCLPATIALMLFAGVTYAEPKPEAYWNVDDLKPGLKGTGLTVMKGTKIEPFDVELLGIMKNTAPGRDLIIARLSGLGLEKTGVIAGMSGSPVTIEGKLVGAIAYAWQFGKEPIAGITPFSQMIGFVESTEEREREADKAVKKLGLNNSLEIGGKKYSTVAIASLMDDPTKLGANSASDELWMMPLQTPVACTGFSAHSLKLFREKFGHGGLLPVMGGAVPAKIADDEKDATLLPGSPMSLAMVTGDFDMSGIGTVTHVDGDRVYGWGHPFMGLGKCEFPMLTGYIHTVYPRQTVSFKMGSPLKVVGVVNADVSTCIAGKLGIKPDMIPVKVAVRREAGDPRNFNVNIVRHRNMLPSLLFTVLSNSVDMEGELPDEMTADIELKIELEGRSPIVLRDTFSGSSVAAGRAPSALYMPLAQMVGGIHNNPFGPLRIASITCQTVIRPGRISAYIESVELDADTVAPGDSVKATVHLRPWKSSPVKQRIEVKLPADLSEGSYTLMVCDDLTRARNDLRDRPDINFATSVEGYLKGLDLFVTAKRTTLSARVPTKNGGVVVSGQALPNLSPGMAQMLGQTRKTGTQTLGAAITTQKPTEWVIAGFESVPFTVAAERSKLVP